MCRSYLRIKKRDPRYLILLYFRVLSRICTLADIRIWSITRQHKQNLDINKAHRKIWCTRVIKVQWERVFHCLNLHKDMLEIVSGVNKFLGLPAWQAVQCLWMMPSSPTQQNLSSLVIKHTKSLSLQNQVFKHLQKVTHEDHFYFLTWNFNTNRPCLDILLTRNVWQFEKLEHVLLQAPKDSASSWGQKKVQNPASLVKGSDSEHSRIKLSQFQS